MAEITVEAADMHLGDDIMVIGATSGVTELTVDDMRVEMQPCDIAPKGSRCSVRIPVGESGEHVRRGDKVFLWVQQ